MHTSISSLAIGHTTPQHNNDVILTSLANPDGILRILFATVALGMGINLRDVNTVIHYGAPNSIDDFFKRVEGVADQVYLHNPLCTGNHLIYAYTGRQEVILDALKN